MMPTTEAESPKQQLEAQLKSLRPDLSIEIRGELGGGLSGADVFLVDCVLNGEPRLGVLKLASVSQAEQEARGNDAAKASWLGPFLPEHFSQLGSLGVDNRMALLASLARHRVEECRTLRDVLDESFFYGREHVLFAVAHTYRMEANRSWSGARLAPTRAGFQA